MKVSPTEAIFTLDRRAWKPGDVVARFGDWRKGEPTVMIDNNRWVALGKPDTVKVVVTP